MARSRAAARAVGVLVAVFVLVGIAAVAVWGILRGSGSTGPIPGQERCVATTGGSSTAVSLEQAGYASIIVGVSMKRDLPPRAATIALTTAYQETGIRNLDYGDRDSVGLFQQRPSQGWGSEKQLMDPYYATNKFYDALVKVPSWSKRDITEVAQAVQRSAYPDAYRDHETDARNLASALTGQSPHGFSCLDREDTPGSAAELAGALTRTYGKVKLQRSGQVITIRAEDAQHAWAYGSFAVANSSTYGTVEVVVTDRQWRTDSFDLPDWTAADDPAGAKTVRITVR